MTTDLASQLTRDAKVFGGDVLTATDISVHSGVRGIGDMEKVAGLSSEVAFEAQVAMKKLLEVCLTEIFADL